MPGVLGVLKYSLTPDKILERALLQLVRWKPVCDPPGPEDEWGRVDEGIVSPGTAMDAAALAASSQQEEALLEAGRSKHHALTSALRARLTNYDVR